jgi:hypothetical protein
MANLRKEGEEVWKIPLYSLSINASLTDNILIGSLAAFFPADRTNE